MLLDPDEETRAKLLNVVYGYDPQPPFCPEHGDTQSNRHTCEPCGAFHRWYRRMRMRFARQHGFQFHKPHSERDDPRPPDCPQGHAAFSTHYRVCQACNRLLRWDQRRYGKDRRAGRLRSTADLTLLREHLTKLEQGGMIPADVAAVSGINEKTIRELHRGERTRVYSRTAKALFAVPVPDRRVQLVPDKGGSLRRSVDGTGTRRRIHAARLNRWPIADQAARLGWPKGTVRNWSHAKVVPLEAADAVAYLYPKLIAAPGGNSCAASLARTEGRIAARFFSEANIDDPKYDPFAVVAKPHGLWRRLRALAYLAHGPEDIAPMIGEPIYKVRNWLRGQPAPAYVNHLVIPVYERLSFTHGSNRAAANLARRRGWESPLAWDDVNMDDPCARPRTDLPYRDPGKTKYVLTSTVFDALDGNIPASHLLRAEKARVVWTLHKRGWSDRRIAAWLRWHEEDLDKGTANVTKFREREGITGYGSLMHGDPTFESTHDLIVWGPAA